MRRLVAIPLGIALALLAGCNPVTSGEVVERAFEPAHTEHYTQSVYVGETCNSYGSGTSRYTSCTPNYIYVPQTRNVPDKWFLRLRDCSVPEEDCREGVVQVAQAVYDATDVGDLYEPPEEQQ